MFICLVCKKHFDEPEITHRGGIRYHSTVYLCPKCDTDIMSNISDSVFDDEVISIKYVRVKI